MSLYQCPVCESILDQPFHADCGVNTVPIPESEETGASSSTPGATAPRTDREGRPLRPVPVPPPPPTPTPEEDPWALQSEADEAWAGEWQPPAEEAPEEPPQQSSDPQQSSEEVPEEPPKAEVIPLPTAAKVEPLEEEPPPPPDPEPVRDDARPPTYQWDSMDEFLLAGQPQVTEYLQEGYDIYLAIGIPDSGKTELLRAYGHGSGMPDTFETDARGQVTATTPNTIISRPITVPGRKVTFIDAAGELFANLLPKSRQQGLDMRALQVPRLLARALSGVVLVIDLEKHWGSPEQIAPEHRRQIEVAAWNLAVLRWLRHDGNYPKSTARSLPEFIDGRVRAMKRRLDFPVLALFSKADVLQGSKAEGRPALAIPGWRRSIFPPGETPLFFAMHTLPTLHTALLRHAEHFRYDFAYSIFPEPDSGTSRRPPCGVHSALDWVMDRSWRRGGLATRHLLAVQRWIDRLTFRGGRWKRLPDPVRLPGRRSS